MQSVEAAGLTAENLRNTDAYLVVTCHYVDSTKPATVLLGVRPFPGCHSASHLTAATKALTEEWAIEAKVSDL